MSSIAGLLGQTPSTPYYLAKKSSLMDLLLNPEAKENATSTTANAEEERAFSKGQDEDISSSQPLLPSSQSSVTSESKPVQQRSDSVRLPAIGNDLPLLLINVPPFKEAQIDSIQSILYPKSANLGTPVAAAAASTAPVPTRPETIPLVSNSSFPSSPRSAVKKPTNSYIELLTKNGKFTIDEIVEVLDIGIPETAKEYSEHLYKIANIIYENDSKLSLNQMQTLERKLYTLMNSLPSYQDPSEYVNSKLHLIVERNFDLFIKIATGNKSITLSTRTVRFLTLVMLALNYWEIYNLLSWKPAIYHFLMVIQFDLNECYFKFIKEYGEFTERLRLAKEEKERESANKGRRGRKKKIRSDNGEDEDVPDDHDQFIMEVLSGNSRQKRRARVDSKLEAHKIIKKGGRGRPVGSGNSENKRKNRKNDNNGSNTSNVNNTSPDVSGVDADGIKSSNYDPDVVHECQLPSADEPNKMCLRRFSRKYELIRHQETVHSKKKKLFKCYVCVKQNPPLGPRIFTRHDTLAKHIRVNHKISGKEAKAEVAYSKKHAEVVEEGDITVHVGRRKTKVDFELRAHMEKRRGSKDESINSQDEYSDE